jgi:hypothetical protein
VRAIAAGAAARVAGSYPRRLWLASLVVPALVLPGVVQGFPFLSGAPLTMRRSARLGAAAPGSAGAAAGAAEAAGVVKGARGRKRAAAGNATADAKHHFFEACDAIAAEAKPAAAGARKRPGVGVGKVAKREAGRAKGAKEKAESGEQATERVKDKTKPSSKSQGQAPAKKAKTGSSVLPDRRMEVELWEKGYKCVAGVDEAGLLSPLVRGITPYSRNLTPAPSCVLCTCAYVHAVAAIRPAPLSPRQVSHPFRAGAHEQTCVTSSLTSFRTCPRRLFSALTLRRNERLNHYLGEA